MEVPSCLITVGEKNKSHLFINHYIDSLYSSHTKEQHWCYLPNTNVNVPYTMMFKENNNIVLDFNLVLEWSENLSRI